MTTLQLLLAAAATAVAEVGAENDAALLRDLVTNNPRKATGNEQLKVWPTNANRAAFMVVMSPNGPPPGHADDPNNRIDEAFGYFTDRVSEYLQGLDEDQPREAESGLGEATAERAERLRITLCDLLKLVSITLEPGDNAQVIFETLNARGTPLLALDLVKNAAFHQAARQGADTDALYEHVWRPQLDDDYWRQERRQGRLNRPIAELFLMHWLTMRLERVIPATELFARFRQHVLGPTTAADSLIREVCADAQVMRSFDAPPPRSPEAQFFARLAALDAGTVLPVVLLLFRSPEVTEARRRRALRVLESWLARRALMRLTAKNYNRLVPRLVAKMKADLAYADDALLESLSGGEGEISRWPSDAEFAEFLRTREVYGAVSAPRLSMALAAVETSLYTNKTEIRDLVEPLSLEHLMPQAWESHWPLLNPQGRPLGGLAHEEAAAIRRSALGLLGNLTIVTPAFNSSLSNAAWSAKRLELSRHSRLLLNARVAERETWDEQAISERGAWLAKQLVRIWPGPGARNWT